MRANIAVKPAARNIKSVVATPRSRCFAVKEKKGGKERYSSCPLPLLHTFHTQVQQTRSSSRKISCRALDAPAPHYDSPSSVTGGTQLESLSSLSKIVRNSVVIEPDEGTSFKDLRSCSSAAAVTSRVLLKVLRSPVGMRQYKQSIESALAYVDKTKSQTKEEVSVYYIRDWNEEGERIRRKKSFFCTLQIRPSFVFRTRILPIG